MVIATVQTLSACTFMILMLCSQHFISHKVVKDYDKHDSQLQNVTARAHDKTGEEKERVTPIEARRPGRIFITL